jgi:hypothetical protein
MLDITIHDRDNVCGVGPTITSAASDYLDKKLIKLGFIHKNYGEACRVNEIYTYLAIDVNPTFICDAINAFRLYTLDYYDDDCKDDLFVFFNDSMYINQVPTNVFDNKSSYIITLFINDNNYEGLHNFELTISETHSELDNYLNRNKK